MRPSHDELPSTTLFKRCAKLTQVCPANSATVSRTPVSHASHWRDLVPGKRSQHPGREQWLLPQRLAPGTRLLPCPHLYGPRYLVRCLRAFGYAFPGKEVAHYDALSS
jgi:hypothetical protein